MKAKNRVRVLLLQARANRWYGVPPDVFLRITPHELRAIESDAISDLRAVRRIEDSRTARIMAAIYNNNPNRRRGAKIFTERDFVATRAGHQSAANLLAKVTAIHNVLTVKAEAKEKYDGSLNR